MKANQEKDPVFLEYLLLFKCLSDPNRMKMIGLLARDSLSGEQLAAMLHLQASTVSSHLSLLAEEGLVSARAEGYYNMYRLEAENFENKIRRLLERHTLPAFAEMVDTETYDRKVVGDYSLPDGHLKSVPTQPLKRGAILRAIARSFEPGMGYTEWQVNEILAGFHDDTGMLRGEMLENHLLERATSGEYWRVEREKKDSRESGEEKKGKKKKKKG